LRCCEEGSRFKGHGARKNPEKKPLKTDRSDLARSKKKAGERVVALPGFFVSKR
jgi:hypothetical protein